MTPPPATEGKSGHKEVQPPLFEGTPTQREGGLLLPIHDKAATVCLEIYASRGFCKWVQGWMGWSNYQRPPVICPSCNTRPLISCGRTKISDPSPKALAESQIAQNRSRHRQLLTFPLFFKWQRIYFEKHLL